jgi:hypothetical protein
MNERQRTLDSLADLLGLSAHGLELYDDSGYQQRPAIVVAENMEAVANLRPLPRGGVVWTYKDEIDGESISTHEAIRAIVGLHSGVLS